MSSPRRIAVRHRDLLRTGEALPQEWAAMKVFPAMRVPRLQLDEWSEGFPRAGKRRHRAGRGWSPVIAAATTRWLLPSMAGAPANGCGTVARTINAGTAQNMVINVYLTYE
jgi:hypothetical protein